MNKLSYVIAAFILLLLTSCASSKSVMALTKGDNIPKYKYVVFGRNDIKATELSDIIMMVHNDI